MRWGAIAFGAAVLALEAGAYAITLTNRAGPPAPTIVTSTVPTPNAPAALKATVTSAPIAAAPRTTAKPVPPGKTSARSTTKMRCQRDGDPTGSDSASCGSGDD